MDYEIKLLRDLVAIDTDSVEKRNYDKMADLLKRELKSIGAKVNVYYANAPDRKPRPNVVGYIDNGKDETVGFNSHFDIVPVKGQIWKRDPFALYVSGDKAYGRGTNDDKGGIVAAMAAAKDAKSKTNVELIFTCDEEVGSKYGLEWLLAKKRKSIKSDYAVVLDSDKQIGLGASGVAMGRIEITGKTAHAGYPFLGKNAITTSFGFLEGIQSFEKKTAKYLSKYKDANNRRVNGRFNITMINSGIKENIIPDKLDARFDMRSPPDVRLKVLVKEFQKYFSTMKKKYKVEATLKFEAEHDGYVTDRNSKIIKKLMKASKLKELTATFGGDDGTYFDHAGIPLVAYGCGNTSRHGPNEYVNISELMKVKEEMIGILENF